MPAEWTLLKLEGDDAIFGLVEERAGNVCCDLQLWVLFPEKPNIGEPTVKGE